MEKYEIFHDVKVFGIQVKVIPHIIGEAFDKLTKMLPAGDERPYYGISACTKEGMVYKATALETFDGEGEKYGCENYLVEKGDYLSVTVKDWPSKTDSIKSVFEDMLKDERSDKTKPCVEIYKNMEEMLCLVKVDKSKDKITPLTKEDLLKDLEGATTEFVQCFASFSQEQINTIPFQGGWTAAQVIHHVHKSDKGMLEMLNGTTKPTEREPDQMIEQIKTDFSDFTTKMESPEFVLPASITFDKERLVNSFYGTRTKIDEAVKTLDLLETCSTFSFPVYGELTRLELVSFIIYHTKRHIHQLEKISKKLEL